MIDIKAHFDGEKDKSGTVIIHAKADIPGICADLELIVAHIVKGLAKQLPGSPELCDKAAMMFAIAAAEGAKLGLKEYKEETE